MQLVCNASPRIFLSKIGLIHDFPKMTEKLVIPMGVYKEIRSYDDEASEWLKKNKSEYVIKIHSCDYNRVGFGERRG